MSRMLRNTVVIKDEDERKAEEEARKEALEARRAEQRAQGVPEEELESNPSSLLHEYVSFCLGLEKHSAIDFRPAARPKYPRPGPSLSDNTWYKTSSLGV